MYLIIILRGLIIFMSNRKHLLNNLLRLEYISLSLYGLIVLILIWKRLESFFSLYYLVIIVCEGCFGLSILVILRYHYRRDYVKNIFVLIC